MADEKKIDVTINPNGEAANDNATNPDQNKAEQKQPGKVKAFFDKHKGKVKTGLVVAGGIAVGIVADKIGIKLGGKKKDEDRPTATEADV